MFIQFHLLLPKVIQIILFYLLWDTNDTRIPIRYFCIFFFLHLTCRRKSMEYSQKITSKSQVKPGHRKWKLVPERSSEEVHRPRVSVRVAVSLLLQPLKRKLKWKLLSDGSQARVRVWRSSKGSFSAVPVITRATSSSRWKLHNL